jgi:hypothetical protein
MHLYTHLNDKWRNAAAKYTHEDDVHGSVGFYQGYGQTEMAGGVVVLSQTVCAVLVARSRSAWMARSRSRVDIGNLILNY